MSAEPGVIDLDEHHRQPSVRTPGRQMPRSTSVVWLVAALLVGAVLGGVAVNEVRDSRAEQDRVTAVSLVALPVSLGGGGSDIKGVLQLDGQLAVINTGPAPITVVAVSGQRTGVLVRGDGRSVSLRPGGTGWVGVKLSLGCATAFDSEPLSVRLSVETADRQARETTYPVAMAGSVWHLGVERLCQPLRQDT